jgi:benzoyl-CoA reductase/2-hydroxyglutaryl-CoA dehydratase subunit BcrC/BadD/HgdB
MSIEWYRNNFDKKLKSLDQTQRRKVDGNKLKDLLNRGHKK